MNNIFLDVLNTTKIYPITSKVYLVKGLVKDRNKYDRLIVESKRVMLVVVRLDLFNYVLDLFNYVLALFHTKFACNSVFKNHVFMWK